MSTQASTSEAAGLRNVHIMSKWEHTTCKKLSIFCLPN